MRGRILFILVCFCMVSHAAMQSSVTINGITWTFDKEYECGQYVSGDWWVTGPVQLTGISNTYHTEGFTPVQGEDGSMINPPTTNKQGYDHTLNSYEADLNVSHPNDQPVSAGNPLDLDTNQSIVSAVSWLYNDASDTETGCPGMNGGTGTPRPVIRAMAILTCVKTAPAANAFRPPYCGTDKSSRFTTDDIDYSILQNLDPPANVIDPATAENWFAKPWVDHVHEYLGGFIHPSEHMPNYGRDLAQQIGQAILLLNMDFDQLTGTPLKNTLMQRILQLGIDLGGIVDNGGYYPPNGGHNLGRKLPIMFAGMALKESTWADIGFSGIMFQEDADHFYVSQAEVDMTNSAEWAPDSRATDKLPYTTADIGLPDWGVRHGTKPKSDNKGWQTNYRSINIETNVSHALAALIMGWRERWNHEPVFDYIDRAVHNGASGTISRPDSSKYIRYTFGSSQFVHDLWMEKRADYGCMWKTNTLPEVSLYAMGDIDCLECVYDCPNPVTDLYGAPETSAIPVLFAVYGLDGSLRSMDGRPLDQLPAGVYIVQDETGGMKKIIVAE